MTHFDMSPLTRTSVGFDSLLHMMDAAMRSGSGDSYPPYNIAQVDKNVYQISIAVAGFTEKDIDITLHENTLVIVGQTIKDPDNIKYFHKGIAGRGFEKRFQLANFIEIEDASMENGLLIITLRQEIPESLQPQKIRINSTKDSTKFLGR